MFGDHRPAVEAKIANATEMTIKADDLWLDLGHLRALVAAAKDLPNDATVRFIGISESHVRRDEHTATAAVVRHEPWERRR